MRPKMGQESQVEYLIGGDRERQAATVQERPRGATPRRKSGWRREELPHARGQGRWRRGATQAQGAEAGLAQEGGEELLHVQGHEGRP